MQKFLKISVLLLFCLLMFSTINSQTNISFKKVDSLTYSMYKNESWKKLKQFSNKTVKNNIDKTEIAKRNMLLLKAHDPKYEPYFALYYNPGGEEKKDYNWSMPSKIFDMINDPCVLIGKDYWEIVGGKDTYKDLLKIFKEVGIKTREVLEKI